MRDRRMNDRKMIVVVKIGTSSLTSRQAAGPAAGVTSTPAANPALASAPAAINHVAIASLAVQVAAATQSGHRLLLVTSGAITAGESVLKLSRENADPATLQALSTVGQSRLMAVYEQAFAKHSLTVGQVLLAPSDFFDRSRYLLARNVLERLLELQVIPIINENDAVANDAIGFGDNDRIAALLAHLVRADMLLLLTDTAGLFTADPHASQDASLISEIVEVDAELEAAAGAAGSFQSRGGMASKLSAAKIAAHSGVQAVIASSVRENVIQDALAGREVGTVFQPKPTRLSARKLWIGFAVPSRGKLTVDAGAAGALLGQGSSLLAVGVTDVAGEFAAGEAVEVQTPDGKVFAKGLAGLSSRQVRQVAGKRSEELSSEVDAKVIHRDQIILLP